MLQCVNLDHACFNFLFTIQAFICTHRFAGKSEIATPQNGTTADGDKENNEVGEYGLQEDGAFADGFEEEENLYDGMSEAFEMFDIGNETLSSEGDSDDDQLQQVGC